MIRTTRRLAQKAKPCDNCGCSITPGEHYLVHVASPNHEDLGNDHWWPMNECCDCARRYGRGALVDA